MGKTTFKWNIPPSYGDPSGPLIVADHSDNELPAMLALHVRKWEITIYGHIKCWTEQHDARRTQYRHHCDCWFAERFLIMFEVIKQTSFSEPTSPGFLADWEWRRALYSAILISHLAATCHHSCYEIIPEKSSAANECTLYTQDVGMCIRLDLCAHQNVLMLAIRSMALSVLKGDGTNLKGDAVPWHVTLTQTHMTVTLSPPSTQGPGLVMYPV